MNIAFLKIVNKRWLCRGRIILWNYVTIFLNFGYINHYYCKQTRFYTPTTVHSFLHFRNVCTYINVKLLDTLMVQEVDLSLFSMQMFLFFSLISSNELIFPRGKINAHWSCSIWLSLNDLFRKTKTLFITNCDTTTTPYI